MDARRPSVGPDAPSQTAGLATRPGHEGPELGRGKASGTPLKLQTHS
jgi:hypothetical protein